MGGFSRALSFGFGGKKGGTGEIASAPGGVMGTVRRTLNAPKPLSGAAKPATAGEAMGGDGTIATPPSVSQNAGTIAAAAFGASSKQRRRASGLSTPKLTGTVVGATTQAKTLLGY